MPLIKNLTTPNGSVANFHQVVLATYDVPAQTVTVTTNSYADQDAYNSGNGLVWQWTSLIGVDALADIETSISMTEPFDGATVVSDSLETLDAMKVRKWADIKSQRDTAINSGFTWDGSVFDSDPVSQIRITGGVVLAQLAMASGVEFSKTWVLADNTTRTLSATDMIGVGIALGDFVSTAIEQGSSLRSEIEAATSESDLIPIVWTGA